MFLGVSGCQYSPPIQAARITKKQIDKHEVKERVYAVVFYRIRDQGKFDTFLQKSEPLFLKYKIKQERVLQTTYSWPKTDTNADRIELWYIEDADQFAAIQKDPLHAELTSLRNEAIEEFRVLGKASAGELVDDKVLFHEKDLSKRDYWVELAYLVPGGMSDFEKYEEESKSYYRKHDRKTERMLNVQSARGIEMPGFLRVFYYDSKEKGEEARKDPARKNLDRLYSVAVAKSVWYRGTALTPLEKSNP